MKNPFKPVDPLRSLPERINADDPRLGQLVKSTTELQFLTNQWSIVGYPDDEGIRINHGRPGAALGPEYIRRHLYRMTPALTTQTQLEAQDLGDLNLGQEALVNRHQRASAVALEALLAGGRWLALGGGHDYGYADGSGFLQAFADHHPLIVNFDAHLDVRPIQNGLNSGTPFRRLLEEFKNFTLVEIGIQEQCNSRAHLEWFLKQGGQFLSQRQITNDSRPAKDVIRDFLEPHLKAHRPVFLSVDMDAFSSSFAPGCSQSWPTGLTPHEVLPTLEWIAQKARLRAIGIYETSPPLDINERTSRLAALIAHQALYFASDVADAK